MKDTYRVRQGGLMRCCLLSLDDAMVAATAPPKEGDTLRCAYGKPDHGPMRFHDGAWEWDPYAAGTDGGSVG